MINQSDIQTLFKPQFVKGVFQKATKSSFVLKYGTRLPDMTGKTYDLDILDNLPIAYWVGSDTEKAKLTKLGLKGKRIYAEKATVIIPISLDSLADSSNVDLKTLIEDRLAEAVAALVDSSVITGSNKPAHFREGIIPSCAQYGATVSRTDYPNFYNAISEAMGLVENSDYAVSAFAGGLGTEKLFRDMLDSVNRPINAPFIEATPRLLIDNGTWKKKMAELLVGDFKQIYYAMRQDVEVKILNEATVEDPNTGIVYNFAQQDMIGVKVTMRMGWEIPNPVSRETWENNPNAFPFAIITPSDATSVLTNNVTLTITNSSGTAISNATVLFGGNELKTDSTGVVKFTAQASQTYPVAVFADGYNAFTTAISVESADVAKTIALSDYDILVKPGTISDTSTDTETE